MQYQKYWLVSVKKNDTILKINDTILSHAMPEKLEF